MWKEEVTIAVSLSSDSLNSENEDIYNAPDSARNLATSFTTNTGSATGVQDSSKPNPETVPTTKDNESTPNVITAPPLPTKLELNPAKGRKRSRRQRAPQTTPSPRIKTIPKTTRRPANKLI